MWFRKNEPATDVNETELWESIPTLVNGIIEHCPVEQRDFLFDQIAEVLIFECDRQLRGLSANDLDIIIDHTISIGMVMTGSSEKRSALLNALSSMYYNRFERQAVKLDLKIALFWIKVARQLHNGSDYQKGGLDQRQAFLYGNIAQLESCPSAADQSAFYACQALSCFVYAAKNDHSIYGTLAENYRVKYSITGILQDLQSAIRYMRRSLKRSFEAYNTVELGDMLLKRAFHCGTIKDLKLAISIANFGLSQGSKDQKYYCHYTVVAANMHYDIFRMTCGFPISEHAPNFYWASEEHEDVCCIAVTAVENPSELTSYLEGDDASDEHYNEPGLHVRATRCEGSSRLPQWSGREWAVLDRCVMMFRMAINLTGRGATRQKYQEQLVEILLHRFGHLESEKDLLEAVDILLTLTEAPMNVRDQSFSLLYQTGNALYRKYCTIGDVDALASSLATFRLALSVATDSSDIVDARLGLSEGLRSHFDLFQTRSSLNEAFDLLQSTIERDSLSFELSWSVRASLAISLYRRSSDTTALNEIASGLRSIWKKCVVNAGHSQQRKFEQILWHIGEHVDGLYEPAKCGAYHDDFTIVETSRLLDEPEDDPPSIGPVYPFAKAWRRIDRAGQLTSADRDLEDAIFYITEALRIKPGDSQQRPRLLHHLANLYVDTFENTKYPRLMLATDIKRAFECWEDAAKAAEEAVLFIPGLARENMSSTNRLRKLRSVCGLAADACYLAVRAGRSPFRCLWLLELGHGLHLSVMMTQQEGNDRDFEPELGEPQTLWSESQDLGFARSSCSHCSPLPPRLPPGLDASPVLLSPTEYMEELANPEDLESVAGSGVIIIINVPRLGDECTAFVIDHNEIQLVPLPKFTRRTVWSWARFMTGELRKEMGRNPPGINRRLEELLAWLWSALVEPIFKTSTFQRKFQFNEMPRVWWIGSGPVFDLPIPFARLIDAGPSCDALEQIVSSFAPTVKVLAKSRKRTTNMFKTQGSKLLFLGMPRTPGSRNLTNIERESEAIVKATGSSLEVEIDTAPTRDDILTKVATFNIVHCACHGTSSAENPLRTGLKVFATDNTGARCEATICFTVNDLISIRGKQCDLAFLSACSTANNPDTYLADECIHLASAFQIAGFPHVIGTSWACSDRACLTMVKDFYTNLMRPLDSLDGHDIIAKSLHTAIRSLRDEFRRRPLMWAAFVHYGP